jgi:hypothetical protein
VLAAAPADRFRKRNCGVEVARLYSLLDAAMSRAKLSMARSNARLYSRGRSEWIDD